MLRSQQFFNYSRNSCPLRHQKFHNIPFLINNPTQINYRKKMRTNAGGVVNYPEDTGSMLSRNTRNNLPDHTASYTGRLNIQCYRSGQFRFRDFKMLKQAQCQTQGSVHVFLGCPFDQSYPPLCPISWLNYIAEYVLVLHVLRPFKFSRLFQECRREY